MEKTASKELKNTVKFGLAPKFIIGIALTVLLVTATAIIIGIRAYRDSITAHYNNMAYRTAETAKSYFTEEEMRYYADLVSRYNHGENVADEIAAVTGSERYREIWTYVDELRESMGANDIFVCFFDLDILNGYTEELNTAGQWNPIYYIMDSYYEPSLQFAMGNCGTFFPEYRTDLAYAFETGNIPERKLISDYQFGYILTAGYPVVYNGEVIALIAVEIPMSTLKSDISDYVVKVLIGAGIVTALMLLIGITFIVKTMINPIGTVAAEADRFAKNNAEISDKLGRIKTRDEIQVLSQSLLRLEIDIKDYIENITRITVEKERIGAELSVATQIQADMLPSIFPAFPGRKEFDIYATMTPAKEVGGDFYDFFLIDDDHLALVMADVSGKGVPAALFMVIAKTLIKNHAQLGEYSPAKVLMSANEQLCEGNEAELFVTVWLAVLEISTGKGMAANAGHEHPALRRKDGKYELVEYRHSPAVAAMEGIRFREHEFELHPGDSLFVYTDGVAEAANIQNELFGNGRMLAALNKEPDASPENILKNVKSAVDEFAGAAPQFDDITMLGFTYFGTEGIK